MAQGLIVADAASLYGAGPAMGQGGGAPRLELLSGDGQGAGDGKPARARLAVEISVCRCDISDGCNHLYYCEPLYG